MVQVHKLVLPFLRQSHFKLEAVLGNCSSQVTLDHWVWAQKNTSRIWANVMIFYFCYPLQARKCIYLFFLSVYIQFLLPDLLADLFRFSRDFKEVSRVFKVSPRPGVAVGTTGSFPGGLLPWWPAGLAKKQTNKQKPSVSASYCCVCAAIGESSD